MVILLFDFGVEWSWSFLQCYLLRGSTVQITGLQGRGNDRHCPVNSNKDTSVKILNAYISTIFKTPMPVSSKWSVTYSLAGVDVSPPKSMNPDHAGMTGWLQYQ